MNRNKYEAADSSLGFYYQSAYSLILLGKANDDGSISVETVDDVMSSDTTVQTLIQLKHSTGSLPLLNEKDDGFWKTIGNWLSLEGWENYLLMFVTCADLADKCNLENLSQTLDTRDTSKALDCLIYEANRVVSAPTVEEAKTINGVTGYDYKIRRPACQSFLNLSSAEKNLFIKNLTLVTSNFNAGEIGIQLDEHLLLSEPAHNRSLISERLIEWWDRRVTKGLLGQSPREIHKTELLEKLSELRIDIGQPKLPDDFSMIVPAKLDSELGGLMQKQIEMVNGGSVRIDRAATERWRSRNQRDRWMHDSLAFAADLDAYDEKLIEEWKSRHGALSHDLKDSDEKECVKAGLGLLDWSHEKAHLELKPFKEGLDLPFLVRGSYQQLADELLVGWHPDYDALCNESNVERRWHNDD